MFILTSVSLAMTPVPLQGASNRTLSNPCMTWKWYEELIFQLLVYIFNTFLLWFCKCLWEEGHLPLIVLKQIVCKTSIYGRKMSFCLGTYWGKLPSIIITDDSIGDPHPVYIPNYGLCPVFIGIIGKNNSCVFHQWSWNVLHTWTTSNFFHSNLLLSDLFIICSKLYREKTVH